jgi:hypothetical protein
LRASLELLAVSFPHRFFTAMAWSTGMNATRSLDRIDEDYRREGSKALAFARALTKDKPFYEWVMPIG